MLSTLPGLRCDGRIIYGSHDGLSIGTVAKLFADRYGLGFEATLDCSAHERLSVPRGICHGVDRVSVSS